MNAFKQVTFLLLACIINLCFATFLGPAQITLKRMEKCADEAENVKLDFEMRRYNRTHVGIDVFVESPYVFGEEIQINATISKWGDGGWKPHVLDVSEPNACEFFLKYGDETFKELLKKNNVPPECPVPKGAYQVKNYIYDGDLSVPVMYGEFMIDFYLIREGIELLCVKLYVKSEPKGKKPPTG